MNYKKMPEVSIWASHLGLLGTLPDKYIKFGGFVKFDGVKFVLDVDRTKKWMDAIKNSGATGFRVLPYCQWEVKNIRNMFSPYDLNNNKKFNLNKDSDNYWDIVNDIAVMASNCNLDFAYGPFDSCGLFKGQKWMNFNPWFNNIQDIKHFAAKGKAENFAMKAVDKTLSELGNYKNFFFYWCNEFRIQDTLRMIEFSKKVFAKANESGIPSERMTLGAMLDFPYSSREYSDLLNYERDIKHYRENSPEWIELKRKISSIEVTPFQDMIKGYSFKEIYGEESAFSVFRPIHGSGLNNGVFEYSIPTDMGMRNPQLSYEFSDDGVYIAEGDDVGIDGRSRMTDVMWYDMAYDILKTRNFKMKGKTIFEICPKDFSDGFQIIKSKVAAVRDAVEDVRGKP